MSKNLLAVYNLGHACGQCSGIGNPVFVPAVDSRGRETPSFDGGTLLSACGLLDRVIHRSGRPPLLPLYALLLLSVPSEFTLRTLFEFDAFGECTTHNKSRCRTRNTPMKRRQPFGLNRAASFFRHEAVRFLTSSIFFVQSSQRRMSM